MRHLPLLCLLLVGCAVANGESPNPAPVIDGHGPDPFAVAMVDDFKPLCQCDPCTCVDCKCDGTACKCTGCEDGKPAAVQLTPFFYYFTLP